MPQPPAPWAICWIEPSRPSAARYGVDDRIEHPLTREKTVPCPGYVNTDPWYDGRAHGYTIIDSPRSGTLLSADKIDEIFIAFGRRPQSDLGAT